MLKVVTTKSFRRSFKRVSKYNNFNMEEFNYVLDLLANNRPIPTKYRDHALTGEYKGFRDIHLSPDILLLYIKVQNILVLELVNIGSHSDLF